MARISDVPHVLRTVGAWGFFKRVYQQINEDLAEENDAQVNYVRDNIEILLHELGELKPLGFPPGMFDTEGKDPGLYPWSGFCRINHIPDDIKPDWLEAATYMMDRYYPDGQ